jgi:hypothetical protein
LAWHHEETNLNQDLHLSNKKNKFNIHVIRSRLDLRKCSLRFLFMYGIYKTIAVVYDQACIWGVFRSSSISML